MVESEGWTWSTGESWETGLLRDEVGGFSMGIPGTPYRTVTLPVSVVPRHEVRVVVKDLPVEVRARRDPRPEGFQAGPLAAALAQSFSASRARGQTQVTPARPEQLAAWGVEGAASALYPLRSFDPSGADTEEVLVLVRGGQVVTLTRGFPGAFTDSLRWTQFATASSGSIRWVEPGAAPGEVPSLWPESDFLEAGVGARLTARRRAEARTLGASLPPGRGLLVSAAPALETLLYGGEPPSEVIDDAMRAFVGRYLEQVFGGSAPAMGYIQAQLGSVGCTQDLRGLALVLLVALGQAAGD